MKNALRKRLLMLGSVLVIAGSASLTWAGQTPDAPSFVPCCSACQTAWDDCLDECDVNPYPGCDVDCQDDANHCFRVCNKLC